MRGKVNIELLDTLGGPKKSISGQKSYFRTLYHNISIFEKIDFFEFSGDFCDFGRCDSKPGSAGNGRMYEKILKMCSLDSLEVDTTEDEALAEARKDIEHSRNLLMNILDEAQTPAP